MCAKGAQLQQSEGRKDNSDDACTTRRSAQSRNREAVTTHNNAGLKMSCEFAHSQVRRQCPPALQAHILLLVSLPSPLLLQLSQLPSDWVNTLRYAWEHEFRRRKQERRRSLVQDEGAEGSWWGRGQQPHSHAPADLLTAHRQLASALAALRKVRGQLGGDVLVDLVTAAVLTSATATACSWPEHSATTTLSLPLSSGIVCTGLQRHPLQNPSSTHTEDILTCDTMRMGPVRDCLTLPSLICPVRCTLSSWPHRPLTSPRLRSPILPNPSLAFSSPPPPPPKPRSLDLPQCTPLCPALPNPHLR